MKVQQFSAKPHILVVDDDERIRDLVSRYLWEHDFVVMEAADAVDARAALERFDVDVMVLDVMMPGQSGVEFTKAMRQEGINVPVLLLTALGESEDRIVGLESGADDYLPKPFEPRELLLRLNAILRRVTKPQDHQAASYKIGRWVFDLGSGILRNEDDTVLSLTSVEQNLMEVLLQHSGQAVSREDLAELCSVETEGRAIDVQVTRLRRKLEEDTKNPRYLQTVRGKGYLLRADVL